MDCQLIRRVRMARNAEISRLRRASIALLVLGTTLNCLTDRDNDATDYPFSNRSFAVSRCRVTNLSDTKGFPLIDSDSLVISTLSPCPLLSSLPNIYTETEGTGEGVWRVRREENTAPKDALRVCIRGSRMGRLGEGAIFQGVFGIVPSCALTITAKEKGLETYYQICRGGF